MPKNKKNLLVTFADRNFIPQVKQLFSSAYYNGGWDGDYMVLTPDMTSEDARWFEEKGIVVNVKPIPVDTGSLKTFPATIYLVFYLFSVEFKKWQQVVYIDVDCIVRASLKKLTTVKSFAAAPEVFNGKIKSQFDFYHARSNPYSPSSYLGVSEKDYKKIFKELKRDFNLNTRGFNAGVMAFNTDVIKPSTFFEILEINKKYGKIIPFPPQGELNLFFYKSWEKLPAVYNAYAFVWNYFYRLALPQIDGVILHLVQVSEKNVKPWEEKSPFYQEWQNNLKKADSINIVSPQKPYKIWNDRAIKRYCGKIRLRQIFFDNYLRIDYRIGLLGRWLNKVSPRIYFFLKRHVKREK